MIQHQTSPHPHVIVLQLQTVAVLESRRWGSGGGSSELSHLHQGVTEIYNGSEAVLVALILSGTNRNFD